MGTTPAPASGNAAATKAEEPKAEKSKSKFKVLARVKGEQSWSELSPIYEAIEQGAAKRDAAYDLAENGNDVLKAAINEGGAGVELVAISARGYKVESFLMERPRPRLARS